MYTTYSQSFTLVIILVAFVALSAARPPIKQRLSSDGGLNIRSIGTTPSSTLTLRIQCKNGFFLQIADDGVVNGSLRFENPNVILQLQSAGPHGLVRIYSTRTKRYIAMNSKGIASSTLTPTEETVFKYEQLSTGYHIFSSFKYLNNQKHMFLALRKNGQAKKGSKTTRYHKGSLFLEVR